MWEPVLCVTTRPLAIHGLRNQGHWAAEQIVIPIEWIMWGVAEQPPDHGITTRRMALVLCSTPPISYSHLTAMQRTYGSWGSSMTAGDTRETQMAPPSSFFFSAHDIIYPVWRQMQLLYKCTYRFAFLLLRPRILNFLKYLKSVCWFRSEVCQSL